MAHDTTHIYKTASSGISLAEIAYVLGDNSDMAKSQKVNKYAKYKPCGGTKVGELAEEERKMLNCGIDTSGLFSSNYATMLTAAKTGVDWNKVTPTWSRVLDFDGYYHLARAPYPQMQDKAANTSPQGSSGDRPYILISVSPNIDTFNNKQVNLKVADLKGALTSTGYNISDFKFALIYRDATNPSAAVTKVDMEFTAGQTIEDNPIISIPQMYFNAPSTYTETITYDCTFIVYAQTGNNPIWGCALPGTYFQVKVALFYLSIDEQTLEFPINGGSQSMIISGFNWRADGLGRVDYPHATMTPSQGSMSSSWQEVELNVSAIPASDPGNADGYYLNTIHIVAGGDASLPADFTKEFRIKQTCKYNPSAGYYIYAVDSSGDQISNVEFNAALENETAVRIKSNLPWKVTQISWRDDSGDGVWYRNAADNGWVDEEGQPVTPDIHWYPTLNNVNADNTIIGYITSLRYPTVPLDREYRIRFESVDSSKGLVYTLLCQPVSNQS